MMITPGVFGLRHQDDLSVFWRMMPIEVHVGHQDVSVLNCAFHRAGWNAKCAESTRAQEDRVEEDDGDQCEGQDTEKP